MITAAHVPVTLTTDRMGRTVALIPDPIARLLTAHQEDGWKEVPDVGWGCSRRFPPNHPVTRAARAILAVTEGAGEHHAMVVGEGDWNPETRTWRDYLANRPLHPRAFDIDPTDGTARFSG